MPIDHTSVYVTDLERSKAFYSDALKPLGYSLMFEMGEFLGFGDAPDAGLRRRPSRPGRQRPRRVLCRPITRRWMRSTRPRPRPAERTTAPPDSASTITRPTTPRMSSDLDGNNIEVVCHKPE